MKEYYCRHCVCLVESNDGELLCDESGIRIKELTDCPNGGNKHD